MIDAIYGKIIRRGSPSIIINTHANQYIDKPSYICNYDISCHF